MTSTSTTQERMFPPLDGLGQMLPRLAKRWPDKTALVTDERQHTFAQLDSESSNVAVGLLRRGIDPGDRVAIFAPNRWEWIVAYHAVLKIGAVVNPLNVMLTGEEVNFVLKDSGAKALIASGDRLEAVSAALDDVDTLALVVTFETGVKDAVPFSVLLEEDGSQFSPYPVDSDALACIAYTSGTTGRPKGAMQSHRSLVLNCAYTAAMHGRSADDVVVSALPAAHVYGNVVINGTLMAGGQVVLMKRFDASLALMHIQEHRATMFEGVPAMYAMMLADAALEKADIASLTRSTVGGQTIATSVIDAWELRSGAPLLELWGMTEISGLGATHALHAPGPQGSVGVALPGVQLKAVRPDDPTRECSPNEPGELMVRGPIVMMGYFNNPAATAETIDADGWLHTGDISIHDGVGHFYIIDRLKDMIVTGGYNVYPAEIERVLIGHPAVAMVGVGRRPDELKGEIAHAYVVPAPGQKADTDELIAYCRTRLAAYKVPKKIHLVDRLPTTSSGKIMRRKLEATPTPAS